MLCKIFSEDIDVPLRSAWQGANLAADLHERHGGIMRVGRAIIISALVTLGAAGSILAGSAIAATAAPAHSAHVQAAASSLSPDTYHHD